MYAEPTAQSSVAPKVARAAGGLAILVGGGHVLAWVGGVMPQVPVSTIIMKTNAGLGLLVAGVALILVATPHAGARRWRGAQICAAFVLLLGLATLSEHIVGWDLGIDQLLATEPAGAAATTSPNRMGVPASLSFILLGTALLLLTRRSDNRRRRALHEPFAVAVALLGLLSIIGYLYGVSALYHIARFTGVAWPTALSFVVLAVGVLCVEPANGLMRRVTADDPGGAIVRALLGPMVLLPLALGGVRLAGERRGWFDAPMGTGLMMLVFIVTFSSLLLFASRRVSASSAAQHESERETRSQKDLLAVTLASIGDAVIVTDAAGRVTFLNAEAARLTGWTEADARGMALPDVFSIVNEETRERVENPVERVLRLGQVIGLGNHTLLIARDGRQIPIDDSGAPIRQAGGDVRGVVLVFRDVTDRRHAEHVQRRLLADVQAQKDRLAALVNSMTDEIWFADADKTLTLGNPAVWKEFGAGLGDARDVEKIAASLEIYRPDGTPRPVDEAPLLRALRGETVTDQEEIIRTPAAGQLRHRQVNAAPVRDADGAIVGSVSVVRDITARKQAEQEARLSQKTFAELIERSPFGTYVVDAQFRIAMMNASSQVGAFRNVRPVIGRDFSEAMRILWPEAVAAEIIGHFRHTLDTGEPYYSPRFVNPRQDVDIVEAYEWELHRMSLPDGQFGVICYYYDSTALREAEMALREADREKRLILDNANEIIAYHDTTNNLVWANKAYLAATGLPLSELKGRKCYCCWGLDRLCEGCPVVRAIETGEPQEGELTPDNQPDWPADQGSWLVRAAPVRDSAGVIIGAIEVAHNVTAQKHAEEAVRRSQAETQALLENTPAGLVLFEAKRPYKVLAHNRYYQELFAEPFRSRGMVGLNVFEYAPAVEAEGVVAVFDEVVRTKQPKSFLDFPYKSDPPKESWFNWHMSPLILDGAVVALVSMSLDVTERHLAEESLRKANAALAEADRRKDEFIAILSHELRNPLAPIRYALPLLGEERLGARGTPRNRRHRPTGHAPRPAGR